LAGAAGAGVVAGAVGAALSFGAAQDGSSFAQPHEGSAAAGAAQDGSEEQELQLELESQLEQDDLQQRCLNKPPKWKPPPQHPPQALAGDCKPATAKQAVAITIINTRFMEASSKTMLNRANYCHP
jgi:hypothetical protein